MPTKVIPEQEGAVGKVKARKGKKSKDEEEGKERSKSKVGKDDPFGHPDEYNDDLPVNYCTIMQYHARSIPTDTMETFSAGITQLLPREQVQMLQQMVLFNQMIGRMIETAAGYASEHDYEQLIDDVLDGCKQVLKVKKVRLFGVDFNSLGQPKELWVVNGETGNLGKSVALNEWCGYAVKKRNSPVFSNARARADPDAP